MDLPRRALPPFSSLRPFEAAARHESFTLAADELGMTQTAVSKQIRNLEADLGTKLFERRNRAVFLTEPGRRFARTVAAALGDVAAEATRLRGSARGGEVVLFCQLCEAFYWLTPRLAGFHAAHPEIELRLQSSIRPLTESGEGFDVAIQTAGRPSGTSRLAFAVDDVVFPVCSPGYLGETTTPLPLEALQKHRLLSHRVAPQDWLDWPDFLALAGLPQGVAKNVMAFDSYPLVLQAAIAGQGIALGWQRTVSGLLADGSLLRPCRESLDRPREVCVYVSPQAGKRSETGALLAWLRRELES